MRLEDTFLPDDGLCPPCNHPGCDDPGARDVDGFIYERCPTHLLEVTEPARG